MRRLALKGAHASKSLGAESRGASASLKGMLQGAGVCVAPEHLNPEPVSAGHKPLEAIRVFI